MLKERRIYQLPLALALVVLAVLAHEATAQAPPRAFQKVMQPYVDAREIHGKRARGP